MRTHPIVLAAALSLLGGCAATTYRDVNDTSFIGQLVNTGGYWSHRGPGNLTTVGIAGNAYLDPKMASKFLMLRCAEVTLEKQKTHFVIYTDLFHAAMDKPSTTISVRSTRQHPNDKVYILMHDEAVRHALDASAIQAQLAPIVKAQPKP